MGDEVKVRSCGDPPSYTTAHHKSALVTVRERGLADAEVNEEEETEDKEDDSDLDSDSLGSDDSEEDEDEDEDKDEDSADDSDCDPECDIAVLEPAAYCISKHPAS